MSEFAEKDLTAIPEAPTGPQSTRDLALPGDLPMIDLDGTPAGGTARVSAEMPLQEIEIDLPMVELADEPPPRKSAEEVARESEALIELVAEAPETPDSFSILPDEQIEAPAPPVRRTMSVLANSVGMLRVRVEEEPGNWALHRQLAEAPLDDGDPPRRRFLKEP